MQYYNLSHVVNWPPCRLPPFCGSSRYPWRGWWDRDTWRTVGPVPRASLQCPSVGGHLSGLQIARDLLRTKLRKEKEWCVHHSLVLLLINPQARKSNLLLKKKKKNRLSLLSRWKSPSKGDLLILRFGKTSLGLSCVKEPTRIFGGKNLNTVDWSERLL